MKTYKIYVNGMYVGTDDFTRSEVTAIESDQDIKLIEKQKGAGKMPKYYVSYNNYFGYCVVEEINGTGKIVFTGSIEKCNQKCIELNVEAINMIQPKRSSERQPWDGCRGSDDGRPERENDMKEKIEELEKELEKVCGTYENDCSKCPKQAECEEYCKLYRIYEGR